MKKILIGLSLSAACLLANNYNVGIAVGKNNTSHSRINNFGFLNLRIGKYLQNNNLVNLQFERASNISGNTDASKLTRALLNVEHDFDFTSKITPYVFAGAGYQWINGDYKDSPLANIGVGSKFAITNNVQWFAEIRALRDFHNNDNHYSGLLGLIYNFGAEEPQEKPQPQAPAKVTPKPAKPDVVVDSDHDGVPDKLDKCPNTPNGVQVDVNGCPLDSDHDGVPNYLDKCPNTPKGVKVNKIGCPISFNFDIHFDTNSAKIKPQYMKKIKEFAEFLKENPGIKAEIQGYTDNRGNKLYNEVLSEKRAKAVYDALIKLGVPKDRLTWAGYGPANPIAPNTTPEGREKNRRVVAKLYY